MFSSLHIRDFRFYFMGLLILFTGNWVQITVQGWLVLEITGSSLYLGVVGFFATLPTLIFTLPFGVIVDRYNKRQLIIISQILFTILTFIFAILISTNIINLYYILIIVTLMGVISSLDYTARQSYVVEIVGKKHLLNAIALNSAAFNISRVIGPVIAALSVKLTSTLASCFYINGISFCVGTIIFFQILTEGTSYKEKTERISSEIKDGFSYLMQNRVNLLLLVIIALQGFFVMPYLMLMPALVKDVLKLDISGLGILMSAGGAGAIFGSLAVARITPLKSPLIKGGQKWKEVVIIYLYLLASFSMVFFSLSRSLLLSCFFAMLISGSIASGMALINNKIQEAVPDNLRGRVMSMYILSFAGFIPLGNLFAGYLSHYVGIAPTFTILGGCLLLFLLFILKPYAVLSQLHREKERDAQSIC